MIPDFSNIFRDILIFFVIVVFIAIGITWTLTRKKTIETKKKLVPELRIEIRDIRVGNIVARKNYPLQWVIVQEIGEYTCKIGEDWTDVNNHLNTHWVDNAELRGIDLDEKWLRRAEFTLERKPSKATEMDGIWYNGFSLLQNSHDGDFNFATHMRGNGEFKSGYQIPHVHRLQNLYHALSGMDLVFKTDIQLKKEFNDKFNSKLLDAVVEFVKDEKSGENFCTEEFGNCAFERVCGYADAACDSLSRGKVCWLKNKLKERGKKG